MSLSKVEIGQQILSSLLNFCILFQNNIGYPYSYSRDIKYGRYKIRVSYSPIDYTRYFHHQKEKQEYIVKLLTDEERKSYDDANNWQGLNRLVRKRELKFFNYRRMDLYFRGKLGFYKDFSMNYIFVIDDEGKYRLRSVYEYQYHGKRLPYWTSIYGLPLDHNRIHLMLYDAMNIAFGWKDDWKKIQKLFTTIELAKVKEV